MALIRVGVTAKLSRNGNAPTGNAIQSSIDQCVADAVEGSFDEYPASLRQLVRYRAARLGQDQISPSDTHADVRFSFGLPAEIFPVESGGLQLLVNLLAGDMFPTETGGCRWQDIHVAEVELPAEMRSEAESRFCASGARTITDLRALFRLRGDWPLLAYSLKPRVGLEFDEIRRMTLDVLSEGFNVVELDSRNLALGTAPLTRWIELAEEAAAVGQHVTAFAPNLSVPAGQISDVVQQWVAAVHPHGPPVVKVDGGLDGLSSLQSIRTLTFPVAPVVTCFPILRQQLASAIGATTWVDLLALCGADIVYPGGRPTFPQERRAVWGLPADDWSRSARTYDGYVRAGRPLPTLAGGLDPGQLHACYELLGPQVAYFLGGAVALHPDGPKAGARLCYEVLAAAIPLARDAEAAGDNCADDLPARLLRRLEGVRYPTAPLRYYSPASIFDPEGGGDAPLPFYRRQ